MPDRKLCRALYDDVQEFKGGPWSGKRYSQKCQNALTSPKHGLCPSTS